MGSVELALGSSLLLGSRERAGPFSHRKPQVATPPCDALTQALTVLPALWRCQLRVYCIRYCLGGSMMEDDHSLMGGVMICNHGGFELVVDRLVSCCWLLLICNVISLIIVPLDMG